MNPTGRLPVHGLFVDLVAPCAADGRLLPREYHVHLRRMARVKDVSGVVVNGLAGEAGVLGPADRARVLSVALSASPKGFPVLAAIPADADAIADEADAAAAAGAAGIIVLGSGAADRDGSALTAAVAAVPDGPILAWGIPLEIVAGVQGVAAAIAGPADRWADAGGIPVMLTDPIFDLDAVAAGAVSGAVLASPNIAEALWGRVFRHAPERPDAAAEILSDRLAPLREIVAALSADGASRRLPAAIKHGLCTLTQNTSAATLPPLVDVGDETREAVTEALASGRLMPGMA